MKILILCKRYYTNKDLIDDQFGRLFHLPVELSRLGADVKVLALDYRNTVPTSQQFDGVTFQTIPAKVRHLAGLLRQVRAITRHLHPDIIIASGDSHIGFVGKHLASSIGVRFVFDVYDYYPSFIGNRIPGMRAMFRFAVKHADLILCASPRLVDRLYGAAAKTVLIENGVNRVLFSPLDKQASRVLLGLPIDAVLIGYFGSITPKRGPLLFEAVSQLRNEIPEIKILLSGKSTLPNLDDSFIIFKGQRSQSQMPIYISACDVVTVPYDSDAFNDMAGPCKIAEYMACERPVVATRVAGFERLFRKAPASLCEPNSDDFARALRLQLEDPQIAPFTDQLEWSRIALQLHQELKAIVNREIQIGN